MLSEAMIRHIVGPEGARALIDIVQGAWDDYVQEGKLRFHRSTRANIVWDYMAQKAVDTFMDADGVEFVHREGRPILVFRGLFAMRPKMHDRSGFTRNYPTSSQLALVDTGLLGDMEMPQATFGYVLDAAEAGIAQCVIASPRDTWIIDLDELASGEVAPVTGMFEMPDLDRQWRSVDPIRLRRAN